jgi:hypothetical protein
MFRSVDSFAIEAFRAARSIDRKDGCDLAREIRRLCSACGGALVAASSMERKDEGQDRLLAATRSRLMEARYYLYLARRLGFLELRRYRQLTAIQDAAVREVERFIRCDSA